ncbi:hypothetical protein VDGL01_08132 [Verticillium dahliae]
MPTRQHHVGKLVTQRPSSPSALAETSHWLHSPYPSLVKTTAALPGLPHLSLATTPKTNTHHAVSTRSLDRARLGRWHAEAIDSLAPALDHADPPDIANAPHGPMDHGPMDSPSTATSMAQLSWDA